MIVVLVCPAVWIFKNLASISGSSVRKAGGWIRMFLDVTKGQVGQGISGECEVFTVKMGSLTAKHSWRRGVGGKQVSAHTESG